ncbi:MAG: 4-alpha-glucanotransferase, partial [Chloroflexota bacterium]
MSRSFTPGLRSLARLHGIQTSYLDVKAERIPASEATLRSLLHSLGVRADTPAEITNALHGAALSRMQTPVEPVFIAWDGQLPTVEVRTCAQSKAPALVIELEHAGTGADKHMLTSHARREVETHGHKFTVFEYQFSGTLPPGYHSLRWETCSTQGKSLVVSAPSRCYTGESARAEWGVFAPLYALRDEADWGVGSYRELARLSRWVDKNDGHLIGTLPILPCFYESDSEPSPYLPVTRLLWSEFFLDIAQVDFLNDCTEAVDIISSSAFTDELARLNQADRVDYPAVLKLKRRVLEALARYAWKESSVLAAELDEFRRSHPLIIDYALFRGALEATRQRWQEWPERLRNGDLESSPAACETRRYHEFAQWLAHRELSGIFEASNTASLYLDLPVGVHPDGYDAWRFKESHLTGVSCGAPPDTVFSTGQSWFAPPPHPTGIRESGYRYWRLCLQHHMRHCDVLRIDHVMGMHRMFCVPEGASASEGTYIRYHPDEMYAIVCLESHRNRTAIVGEDLGTVPDAVRRAMTRHGLKRMFVLYY